MGRTLSSLTSVTAEDLRRPVEPKEIESTKKKEAAQPASCQVICIASGKGGTGKTVVSTNLAVALVRKGLKVVLLDGDLGLANAHLLLGVEPAHDISAVVSGEKSVDEISVDCPAGVRLIAGGSGISELAELKEWQFHKLAEQLRGCEEKADIMIMDLAAGISSQVMRFLANAHEVIIVTTPDVTAQIDAYATIKTMTRTGGGDAAKIVINRARGEDEARAAYRKLSGIVRNRLKGVKLSLLGWIPQNWYVQNSIHARQPVVDLHPKSFVTRTFLAMADDIKGGHIRWRKVLARGRQAPKDEGTKRPVSFSQMLKRINIFK